MIKLRARTPRWVIIVIDLLLAASSLAFAYLIRFDLKADSSLIQKEWMILSKSIGFYFLVKFSVFYFYKIHKGLVRYTSTEDLKRIFLAVLNCSFIFLIAGFIRYKFLDDYFLFPMSVLILEFLAGFAFAVGSRFIIKLLYLERTKSKHELDNVLIYGAGVSGIITKRTIENDPRNNQNVIGFVDDNAKLSATRIEGTKIFHTEKIRILKDEFDIKQLIVAIQNPNVDNLKKVLDTCLDLKIAVQKVPNPKSWVNGEFTTKQLSKINIEDLLGRKPISLSNEKISEDLNGKVILVTGAAGSIGSGLTKEIAKYKPSLLLLLDQAESPVYDLQFELATLYPDLKFEVIIGDICNENRMRRIFNHFNPQFVYHAAAYKHVPMMELNPAEAVLNNINGTKVIADLSIEFGVRKFVMISTDKAVNPTNVMGASKRIAEIYVQSKNDQTKTQFITTRFGNVLGSNGSVIPLFQKQIENGGPITVTDERITRFFMTIPEACQLVLEAGTMGIGGEIYVFDMGESVKIIDLAKKIISLSGLELGKDIDIKITGLRPGEKLYEELLANEENTLPTHHDKILIAKIRAADSHDISKIDQLINSLQIDANSELVQKMKDIVPEFISNNSEFEKLDK
jgi:FlaA1/EpsC-like NDP-sugar epimerase